MKLFKCWQDKISGYGTFDAMVVAAEDEDRARMILPSFHCVDEVGYVPPPWDGKATDCWDSANHVQVEYIGEAAEEITSGQILASFNAG